MVGLPLLDGQQLDARVGAVVGSLKAELEWQRKELRDLRRVAEAAAAEAATLRACLREEGLLGCSEQDFAARLRRRDVPTGGVEAADLLRMDGVVALVGECAGRQALRAASAAASRLRRVPAWEELKAARAPVVYLCGGEGDHGSRSTRVGRFDPLEMTWSTMPPMLEGRCFGLAATLGGYLYVCGGEGDRGVATRAVERFDPVANTWGTAPPMREARSRMAGGVAGGRLYVCGGLRVEGDKRLLSGDVECLAASGSSAGSWEAVRPLSQPRLGACAGVLDGHLYVCGGSRDERLRSPELLALAGPGCSPTELRSVECLSPAAGAHDLSVWRPDTPMLERRFNAASATAAGRLFVCGGACGSEHLRSVEFFDRQVGHWERAQWMSSGQRLGAAAATVGSHLLLVFGGLQRQLAGSIDVLDIQEGRWLRLDPEPGEPCWSRPHAMAAAAME